MLPCMPPCCWRNWLAQDDCETLMESRSYDKTSEMEWNRLACLPYLMMTVEVLEGVWSPRLIRSPLNVVCLNCKADFWEPCSWHLVRAWFNSHKRMHCHLRGGTDKLTQPKMYLIECQESCFHTPEIPFRGHTQSEQQDFEPLNR
jgi:hypothetical protein